MKAIVARFAAALCGYILGSAAVGCLFIGLAALGQHPFEPLHGVLVTAGGLAGLILGVLKRNPGGAVPEAEDVHGSARFSLPAEDRPMLGGDHGLIVGRQMLQVPQIRGAKGSIQPLIRYRGEAHLLTIAPTRSGKGVGAILPNLLTVKRSILCIDPKGENARVSAQARRRLGPVFILDPFQITALDGAAFNPLSSLDPKSIDLAEDAASIAEAMVQDPPYQGGEAHWNEEAKALIAGVILHVVTTIPPPNRTLSAVRDLLTVPKDQFSALMDDMQASTAASGLVARAANRHRSKSEREAAGVISSAQRHTHFLDSPRMAAVLQRTDFTFEALKEKTCTIFLVLPPDRLGSYARWLRLLVVQALSALAKTPENGLGREPVLLLLDEFAALGHLEPVRAAFGLMAGYGVQLWVILQDLHQLKGAYGRSAGTFLSNAGLIQVFNVADIETASWISRLLGARTQAYETSGDSRSRAPTHWLPTEGDSTHVSLSRRELLTPDEVMRLPADQLLVLRPGERPTLARKVRYFVDPEFKGRFDP